MKPDEQSLFKVKLPSVSNYLMTDSSAISYPMFCIQFGIASILKEKYSVWYFSILHVS